MAKLTVHCMVRDEPFLYYAVKSVYEYADVIFLYDTGSSDAHTLEDIQTLVKEDVDHKIVFKQVPIQTDERHWTVSTVRQERAKNAGKFGKGAVRLQQIQETWTPFFMILDGDEVHYEQTMHAIRQCIDHWPVGKACGFVGLTWYCDMTHWFKRSASGRVFLTERVGMQTDSPGELHVDKETNAPIGPGSSCSFSVPGTIPFAHFESILKPWRRRVLPSHIKWATRELPEVMKMNVSYVERFLSERGA